LEKLERNPADAPRFQHPKGCFWFPIGGFAKSFPQESHSRLLFILSLKKIKLLFLSYIMWKTQNGWGLIVNRGINRAIK